MLRHLHIAVLLVALNAFTNAVDLPEGFLRPRQDVPLVSGGGSGSSSSSATVATTIADPTTTQQPTTTVAPTTSPTTPSTSAQPPTTTQQSNSPTTQAPTTVSQSPSVSASPSASPTTQQQQTTQRQETTAIATQTGSTASQTITSIPSATDPSVVDSATTITSTNLAPVPETLVTITYTSDGRLISTTATGTRTTVPTSTSKPGLASGYGNENNTLSEGSKKLIGGIVGGIGGTLLLAGIAFVVYKMWGRKKHQKVPQEEEFFGGNGSTDSIAMQKESNSTKSGWGASSLTSKFSEPLDRYKSPGGSPGAGGGFKSPQSVNAASNF